MEYRGPTTSVSSVDREPGTDADSGIHRLADGKVPKQPGPGEKKTGLHQR